MIAHYVANSDAWYVKKLHPLNLAVADAEKLHTEWKAGTHMTGSKAKAVDQVMSNASAFDAFNRSKRSS